MRNGSLRRPVCLPELEQSYADSDDFRDAFTEAGLPCFNPHSVRNTFALLGEKVCSSPEQFKAWSQNLGHEKVLTTFSAYGAVAAARQTEIIRELGERTDTDDRQLKELAQQLMRVARRTPA